MARVSTRKFEAGQLLAAPHREEAPVTPPSAPTKPTEDDFATFFANSHDLLCMASPDGYFTRLKPSAWTACLGWSLEELEAEPVLLFVHPDDRDATVAEVQKLTAGAETIAFENRCRHRDGSWRWLQWNARVVPGRQQIYAAARDATTQRRLQEEILEIADKERSRLGRDCTTGCARRWRALRR